MKYLELRRKISDNIFSIADVGKYFSDESESLLRLQLSRFVKKGLIFRIKKGLYCFNKEDIDELVLAFYLYQPSYISLQTALFYYGVIIDIPQTVTSITTIRPKFFKTPFGNYQYYKVKTDLFFGYQQIKIKESYINMATLEKALLDYFYIYKIKSVKDLRLNLEKVDKRRYQRYLKSYPDYLTGLI